MKRVLFDNLKNVRGWRTAEKLVVLAVDDYGNVRQDSIASRKRLSNHGLAMGSRFDAFDTVENRQDLEGLFEVLSSVTDGQGRSAVLTPYTLCANLDFDSFCVDNAPYHYQTLPDTFARLEAEQGRAYRGAWALWQEGVQSGLLKPQFHGREHLNVEFLERKKRAGDKVLRINLENRSLTALGPEPSMPGVGFSHAFGVWDSSELDRHREVIADGLDVFERVFGFRSITFTPPALQLHPDMYAHVETLGVRAIDKASRCVRTLDKHETKRELNILGKRGGQGHVSVVRNAVFEPTRDLAFDSVKQAVDQVSAAFRWHKPAIISSHRVNFAGHIDPENRKIGLAALKQLLDEIVGRWPDAQFISADTLVEKIERTQ